MSALRDAIDKLGGVTECARVCGITPRGVYKWLQRDSLPRTEYTGETSYARRMADASQGAFTAEWLLENATPFASDSPPTDTPKATPGRATATTP